MTAQSFLAKHGMRSGVLGSNGDLAVAAPLAAGDPDPAAHTDANRIGWWYDRTGASEGVVATVMGSDRFKADPEGIDVGNATDETPTIDIVGKTSGGIGESITSRINFAGDGSLTANFIQVFKDFGVGTAAVMQMTAASDLHLNDGAGNVIRGVSSGAPLHTLGRATIRINVPGRPRFQSYWEQVGIAAPSVSAGGEGLIYFDSTLNTFRVSENGGAFKALTGELQIAGTGTDNLVTPSVGAFAAAIAGMDNNIAIGRRALEAANNAGVDGVVAIGLDALAAVTSGTGNSGVGASVLSTLTTENNNTGFGDGAGQNQAASGGTFLGQGADGGAGADVIAVGRGATATAADATAVGAGATAGHINTLVLGSGATSTSVSQCVIGSPSVVYTDFYLGAGVTSATGPSEVDLHASGGVGTDIDGSSLVLSGGRSTGAGAGGDVLIRTTPSGPSSSTLNGLVTRFKVDADTGNVSIDSATASTSSTTGALTVVGGISTEDALHVGSTTAAGSGQFAGALSVQGGVRIGFGVGTGAVISNSGSTGAFNPDGIPDEYNALFQYRYNGGGATGSAAALIGYAAADAGAGDKNDEAIGVFGLSRFVEFNESTKALVGGHFECSHINANRPQDGQVIGARALIDIDRFRDGAAAGENGFVRGFYASMALDTSDGLDPAGTRQGLGTDIDIDIDSGNWTALYGVRVDADATGSTTADGYGLHINVLGATNNWALWVEAGNTRLNGGRREEGLQTVIGAGGSPDATADGTDTLFYLDGSSNTATLDLDASPDEGQLYYVKSVDSTNTVTIGRNGNNIDGVASDLTLATNESVLLHFTAAHGWRIL